MHFLRSLSIAVGSNSELFRGLRITNNTHHAAARDLLNDSRGINKGMIVKSRDQINISFPHSLSISIRTKNKMNEDDDEFGDSIDWSAIPLNTIGASMAVPTPMGMTSHAVGANYSSASNNNYHQHQTMTKSIGGAVPMHHTAENGATSSTATATATSIYNNNSVYQQPPQNGQNYSAGMGATNFPTNSVNEYEYGNSNNDAEALRRQVSNSVEPYCDTAHLICINYIYEYHPKSNNAHTTH